MKKHLSTAIIIIIFLAGISLLLYPTVSDRWNQMHQSRAITTYAAAAAELDDADYEKILEEARAYNERLAVRGNRTGLTEGEKPDYEKQLAVTEDGAMGYIEIPKIGCRLPVYHGTSEGVLQTAIGHLEGTSLPAGGENTHCVLSGHRGLPSARLFTDLDQLGIGDRFFLCVLDEVLVYEIDQVLTVLPEETGPLAIEEGADLCTLVTCTPYGVNSHRMLVRGRRVEEQAGEMEGRITADAVQVETPLAVSAAAAPLIPALLFLLIRRALRRKKTAGRRKRTEKT